MDNKVSLIGTDGKVRWIEERKVPEFIDKGWRHITNPKEVYYPQYDARLKQVKPDEVGNSTRVIENIGISNPLGIVAL